MESVVLVDEQQPLLHPSRSPSSSAQRDPIPEHEILPCRSGQLPVASENDPPNPLGSPEPTRRLASLDVFRGLTVALMILVDDAGGSFVSVNHAPWTGVTLADFVMPFFLFGVGVSVAIVFKKRSNKTAATKKAVARAVNLFILGVFLQGGYFHGHGHLDYGVDLSRIRWLGVLQRIAIGYIFAAVSEIWLVSNITVHSPVTFLQKYYIEWLVAVFLCAAYMGLLYGLYVPNWKFPISSVSKLSIQFYGEEFLTVHCGVSGSLGPPCNAVGLVDRLVLGTNHLYQNPVYKRTKSCSVNSPDYGPLPPNAPEWCLAPFDPEGLLSSLMAAVTCFIGLHFGHLLLQFKSHTKTLFSWVTCSLVFLIAGYIAKILGMPLSKPLYTLSYMLISSGVSGLLLSAILFIVDVKGFRKPTLLFQWVGMNALIIYSLAACELFPAFIQGFYWRDPANNLVNLTETALQRIFYSKRWGTLMFVLLEILFWCLFAGFLHMKHIYVKL